MSKKILVTGSQGFIGAVMVPMLQDRGYEVVGLDTDLYRDADFGPTPSPISTLATDVRDVQTKHLEGMEAVIHLAALSNDPLGNLEPQLTYDINHHASVDLARKAKAAGVPRFLFSSSCSSYGAAGDELLTEDAEFNPITPYGESKVQADREISELAEQGFSPTFLRNATAYGFSPRLRLDLVVNDFVAAAFLDKRIFIKSDGTPWRPLVHVQDICSAFIAVLEAPIDAIHNEAFNVGITSENYRVSEIADIVAAVVPGCEIAYDPDGGPDKRCYRVNCDKILSALPSFKPQWDVKRGAEELLDAYQRLGLSAESIESKRFLRLAGLERRQAEGIIDGNLRPVNSSAT